MHAMTCKCGSGVSARNAYLRKIGYDYNLNHNQIPRIPEKAVKGLKRVGETPEGRFMYIDLKGSKKGPKVVEKKNRGTNEIADCPPKHC